MMAEQVSKVPSLRFPEFGGVWEESRLGEIATFSKGKGVSKSEIDENGDTECIRYGELYTHYGEVIKKVLSRTNVPKADLVLSEFNDVIIPASGETQLDIATASCVLKSNVALGGDLNIIKSPVEGVFLSYYLNNSRKKDIARLSQGISVVHLYANQLKSLHLNLPSKVEQQKIADFLTAVDKRIEQLEEKKRLLTEYKKGVMQQIFSQQIRFDAHGSANVAGAGSTGATNDDAGNPYPDWQEKRLGDMCNITTGKLDANAMVEGGQYRFYTCAKDYFRIDKYHFDTEALLISGNGANVGYIHYYKGKFNAYQRTYVLDAFSETIIFIKYILEKDLRQRIYAEKKEGNTPYIVLGTLSDMALLMPSDKGEQQKIADFLTSIDNKIEQVSSQLEQAKAFKKGLLQQMFV